MYNKRVTYLALTTLLPAISCTSEMTEPGVSEWIDGDIYFRTSLADIAASRAADMTLDHLETFQVTCFNTGDIHKDADGIISPYFENATFVRRVSPSVGVTYESSPAEGPRAWPDKDGLLKFFAFYPSPAAMRAANTALTPEAADGYYNLINTSSETDSGVSTAYRLGPVKISRDISEQFDLVTAAASGRRWHDFNNGVELALGHRLCQVDLKAWGGGAGFDFEIAGVRLGNPVVEGTFVFCDDTDPAISGTWQSGSAPVKDKVEYIYRPAAYDDAPAAGDNIYYINADTHHTPESAESIMGHGGCAMVIPTLNSKWEGLADPHIATEPYSTGKMYFSILLRVTNSKSGKQIYPYLVDQYGMTVIRYAVDPAGKIVARLYDGADGICYTDPQHTQPFTPAEGIDVREYGWAAVPVDVDWTAGHRYVYTLNYADGIGIHDPEDPAPGTPIAGLEEISWGVSVGAWEYAAKSDDYQPDINVP